MADKEKKKGIPLHRRYLKGKRYEQKIVNELKAEGYEIAQRTAGSKSPIDIFAIHKEKRWIKFVQAKSYKLSKPEEQRIRQKLSYLNGMFMVDFALM